MNRARFAVAATLVGATALRRRPSLGADTRPPMQVGARRQEVDAAVQGRGAGRVHAAGHQDSGKNMVVTTIKVKNLRPRRSRG